MADEGKRKAPHNTGTMADGCMYCIVVAEVLRTVVSIDNVILER